MGILILIVALVITGLFAWLVVAGLLDLIEVMIIIVIIGLLAAMAIPAYLKVKETNIAKAIQRGDKVSREDRAWYEGKKNRGTKVEPKETPSPADASVPIVTLDNKRFYLVLKDEAQETRINGKTYWLIPITP